MWTQSHITGKKFERNSTTEGEVFGLIGPPEDVGCRSMLDPIIETLRAGDRDTARAEVAAVIRTIEQMPLPSEGEPVVPRVRLD